MAPAFVYPREGALAVDASRPLQWTAPPNTRTHQLHIGTTPGGKDVYAGELAASRAVVAGLPRWGTLYARAFAQVGDNWRYTDIAFTLEATPAASTIVRPSHGARDVDTVQPLEWADVPLARGYRLTIGTTEGAADLHDSGVIHATRRFVPNLPVGPAYGRIYTRLGDRWESVDFRFDVSRNTSSTTVQLDHAAWAASRVRAMAAIDNRPFSWTLLAARGFFVIATNT